MAQALARRPPPPRPAERAPEQRLGEHRRPARPEARYTDAQLDAAAYLAQALSAQYRIPLDRAHHLGHPTPTPGAGARPRGLGPRLELDGLHAPAGSTPGRWPDEPVGRRRPRDPGGRGDPHGRQQQQQQQGTGPAGQRPDPRAPRRPLRGRAGPLGRAHRRPAAPAPDRHRPGLRAGHVPGHRRGLGRRAARHRAHRLQPLALPGAFGRTWWAIVVGDRARTGQQGTRPYATSLQGATTIGGEHAAYLLAIAREVEAQQRRGETLKGITHFHHHTGATKAQVDATWRARGYVEVQVPGSGAATFFAPGEAKRRPLS
ncbi:MAG: N-acetylmuramoyl-L-alanine amidase [bacterium]